MRRTPLSGVPLSEKRQHPRVAVPARCWIGDGRRTIYMPVYDLSRGGLSVRAPVPFSPSDQVELRLELPGGRAARARGEIVWVNDSRGATSGPRMGARFVEWLAGEQDFYGALPDA